MKEGTRARTGEEEEKEELQVVLLLKGNVAQAFKVLFHQKLNKLYATK